MKVLVTGASGYLGRRLIKALDEEELLLTYFSARGMKLNDSPREAWVDVESPDFFNVAREFAPDVVINAAGVYDNRPLADLIKGNLTFPLSLMEALSKTNLKRWINVNTALPRTLSAYALSKHQFGEWGDFYSGKYGFAFGNVLLQQFYGANDGRFLSFVIQKLLNNELLDLTTCLQRRDLIHVEDTADGIIHLSRQNLSGYLDVPLGCGVAPTLKEVVLFCQAEMSSKSEIHFGAVPLRSDEPMLCVADLSVMRSMGFLPKRKWKDGLREMIGEMKK